MQPPNLEPGRFDPSPSFATHAFGEQRSGGADPYRPALGWRIALGAATLVLLIVVVVLQRPEAPAADAEKQAAAGLSEHLSPSFENTLFAKMFFGLKNLGGDPNLPRMMQDNADATAGFKVQPAGLLKPRRDPDKPLPAAIDRLHAAVLAGETLGAEEALSRLEQTEPQIDPASPLAADAAILRRVYSGETTAEVAASMEENEREQFLHRHGLFGELALSYGEDNSKVRMEAGSSGLVFVLSMMLFGGLVLLVGLVGVGLLIYLIVMVAMGRMRPRFVGPREEIDVREGPTRWGWGMDPQGRLIWLETVAVFLLGFLLLRASGDLLHAKFGAQAWLAYYSLIGQWALVLTIFWPIVRGMTFKRWCREIGWHRGRGVWREIGSGLMVYVASLPIYFFMALVVVILVLLAKSLGVDLAPKPESSKIVDMATSGNPLVLLLIFLLATVWAPVVEESIFRGALYRHVRWLPLPAAAVAVTAVVFAVMHGYAVVQLLMVGVLGVTFALMREWRDSLIPSVTAHFTHNAVVLTVMLVVFGQMG